MPAHPLPYGHHPYALGHPVASEPGCDGALGTGFALLLRYGLVAEVGPATAQMVTCFIPVSATAAGVAVLDEQLGRNTLVDALIVLAGAALTQSRPKAPAPAAQP